MALIYFSVASAVAGAGCYAKPLNILQMVKPLVLGLTESLTI
jgi:hypothetical protein